MICLIILQPYLEFQIAKRELRNIFLAENLKDRKEFNIILMCSL